MPLNGQIGTVSARGGVTGYSGGQLQQLAKHNLHVPLDDMGMVESIHLLLFHWILDDVHARINGIGRYAVHSNSVTTPVHRAA